MEKYDVQMFIKNLTCTGFLGGPKQKPQQLELEDSVPKKPLAADS